MRADQNKRYDRLLGALGAMKRATVAFSGGVDSALLLYAAGQALRDGVLAVTFATPYVPREELARTAVMARDFGLRRRMVALTLPDELRDNPPERCYLCKRRLFGWLVEIAREDGSRHVLDGGNLDDLDDHRPGRKAAEELGVKSPLLDAGMSKRDIRDISKELGLPGWNRPAGACLLTRLPHGVRVDEFELARIDEGEGHVRALGFPAVRLRSHGDLARIEVPRKSLAALCEACMNHELAARLKALGYRHVTLDLEGYRMGGLNEPD